MMLRGVRSRMLVVQTVFLLMGMPPQLAVAGPLPAETKPILAEDAHDVAALNVSIAVFDPGVPADPRSHRDQQVFPRIREIEAMFLPFVLRETLAGTKAWGAVRVVPQHDVAAELLLTGEIIQSDGEILELKIRAVDANGRVWLDRAFAATVENQELFFEIAAALQTARAQLSKKELTDIVEISLLRYANQLAPSAFGDYLHEAADGTFTIIRLPACNDPMLGRIDRLRRIEYVITDAVDAKFQELHEEIASTYNLWREYRRQVIEYQTEDVRRAQDSKSSAPRGSYEAMKNRYDNYKWNRITAQEQETLAVAFNNEIGPKVAAMEARVAELQGWVDQKYAEWHRLLEELFEVETGLR